MKVLQIELTFFQKGIFNKNDLHRKRHTDKYRKDCLSRPCFSYQKEKKRYLNNIHQLDENDIKIKQSEAFVASNAVQSWLIDMQ